MAADAPVRLLTALVGAVALASASEGDRDPAYNFCREHCMMTGCLKLPPAGRTDPLAGMPDTLEVDCNTGYDEGLDPLLVRLGWDWASDCAYRCMHYRNAHPTRRGKPTWKYYGKWPFERVYGMQEVCSVGFSALLLLSHLARQARLFRARRRLGASDGYGWVWALYGLANCNTWVWSAVFHARDTWLTERLDYFSANAVLAVGLYAALLRTLELRGALARVALFGAIAAGLAQHVSSLLVFFDYGYNMKVCVGVGLAQSLLWLRWAVLGGGRCHPGVWRGLVPSVLLTYATLALELYDHPPLGGLLDAHAAWHLATVPVVHLFYAFLDADAAHLSAAATGAASKKTR